MPQGRSKPSVFVSHSSADKQFAESIKEHLRNFGLDVWSATEDIQPGARWASTIHRAVRQSDVVVVLVGKTTLQSPSVSLEVAAAIASNERDNTKHLIPVIVDPSAEPEGLLAAYQWLRATNDAAQTADDLLRLIGSLDSTDKAGQRIEEWSDLKDAERHLRDSQMAWALAKERERQTLAWITSALSVAAVALLALLLLTDQRGLNVFVTIVAGIAPILTGTIGYRLGTKSDGRR